MPTKCDNCGQTVAVTDSECWHCGQTFTPDIPETATDASPVPDFGTILRYAGLTAVSLLLLILATRAIGQVPLLPGAGNLPPVGWQAVTDEQLQFTLNLPDSWQTIDLTANPTAQEAAPLPTLADSFATLVADSELLFWMVGEETAVSPPFTLIARSQRLAQLTPEQYVSYASQQLPDNVAVTEAEIITDDFGNSKGQLTFELQQNENSWRCLHQFVADDTVVYLLTACAQSDQFSNFSADFAAILRSFQPLEL